MLYTILIDLPTVYSTRALGVKTYWQTGSETLLHILQDVGTLGGGYQRRVQCGWDYGELTTSVKQFGGRQDQY